MATAATADPGDFAAGPDRRDTLDVPDATGRCRGAVGRPPVQRTRLRRIPWHDHAAHAAAISHAALGPACVVRTFARVDRLERQHAGAVGLARWCPAAQRELL